MLVAGTQRFFLADVAKYCSVSQDVTHNENHFVTFKDESNEYSENPELYLINLFDKLQ